MNASDCFSDDRISQIIKTKARSLAPRLRDAAVDVEDITQDLTIELLSRLPRFNPKRSSIHTFATRIIGNAAGRILSGTLAGKRGGGVKPLSLNYVVTTGGGVPAELGDTISEDDYFSRTDRATRPFWELCDLRLDLQRGMATLPPSLKDLCGRLMEETPTEVAHSEGVSRETIYRRIRAVRAAFEEQGLGKFQAGV